MSNYISTEVKAPQVPMNEYISTGQYIPANGLSVSQGGAKVFLMLGLLGASYWWLAKEKKAAKKGR